MRALLQDTKSGQIATYDVPAPETLPGCVLVRTAFSAISAGTEKAKMESGQKSLLGKVMARPDLVKQVADYARSNGIKAAWDKVQSQLNTLSPLGYSCSGYVLEAGAGAGYVPGERVACAGVSYANHCEVNCVPRNLVARIPKNVPMDAAALTTLGAIALQGVRQAEITLGETVAVIGAGLVGVLAMQVLRAAGCRVIGIDSSPERAARALSLGAHLGLATNDPELESRVTAFSHRGVDAVLITAATPSAEPLELAAKLLRDRGRIVIVGDVGMGVSRGNMYGKELSLHMSRSYGPGRYDPFYEEGGCDYPIGYVRWTEQRNMEAFLDMLSNGTIRVDALLTRRYTVAQGAQAYADLSTGIYTAIIDYQAPVENLAPAQTSSLRRSQEPQRSDRIRVGCLGAGTFARGVILPFLRSCKQVTLESVATGSGVTAETVRRAFGFLTAESPSALLSNVNVDAAFIITRHDSHAAYVERALEAGKAVFVEKPLAINRTQLHQLAAAHAVQIERGKEPFLMVGFNRRFAPHTAKLQDFFQARTEPMLVHIRCNAGFIPRNTWIQSEARGSRIIGELCHFIDWARAVVRSPVCLVIGAALPDAGRYNGDNLSVTLSFQDGSIANLLYLANGDRAVPKEYIEVFCQGSVARLDDFRTLSLTRAGKTRTFRSAQDKGHRRELELTLEAMLRGDPAPIRFEELFEVTNVSFAIDEAIRTGQPVPLRNEIQTYATVEESRESTPITPDLSLSLGLRN